MNQCVRIARLGLESAVARERPEGNAFRFGTMNMRINDTTNGTPDRQPDPRNEVVVHVMDSNRQAWCVTQATELLGARPVKVSVVVACPALATNGVETFRCAFLRLCASLTPFRCIQPNSVGVLACARTALEAFHAQVADRAVPVLVGVFQKTWGVVASTLPIGIHDASKRSLAAVPSDSSSSDGIHGYSLVSGGPFLLAFPDHRVFDFTATMSDSRINSRSPSTLVDRASESLQGKNIAEPCLVLGYGADGEGRASKCLDSSNSLCTDRETRESLHYVPQVIATWRDHCARLEARFDGPFRSLVDQLGRAQDALRNTERDGWLRQLGQVLGTLEEALARQRDAGSIRAAYEQLRSILESQDVEVFQGIGAFDPARHELLNPEAAGRPHRLVNVRSGLARGGRVLLKQRVTAIPVDVAVSIQPLGGSS